MDYKDYYTILGVARDVDQAEIKKSYRKLARKYHPDVSKETNAEDKFKELNEAYEVLKDPEKRKAYDQLGENWQAGQGFTPPPDWDGNVDFRSGGYTGADTSQFSDFFENLFGRRGFEGAQNGRGNFSARGSDSHAKVGISLEDAYQGNSQTITLQHRTFGPDGQPRIENRTLKIKIPKGVYQGQNIRLEKQGEAGFNGAESGNLYLEIDFLPHSIYRPEGKNVYLDLPVSPWEAALGEKIKIPLPSGKSIDLTIPENTPNGRKLRLKNQGIPAKQPGDLYVVVNITLPTVTSEKEKEAFRKLSESFDFNPRTRFGAKL